MTNNVSISFCRLPHGEGLKIPEYETNASAGMDLPAAIGEGQKFIIGPGKQALVPTGFAMALPSGFEAQIRPRSGLAAKNGVTILNTPGTIDADYRGEVKIIIINLGSEPFKIERGMRIAQMVIAPVTQGTWNIVSNLDETKRGSGGFGSTGVS
ncbi:MAG: dUTP diphosphatase [Sphingomonadales bacterium]|jgi:dUTP pyrophosphatase